MDFDNAIDRFFPFARYRERQREIIEDICTSFFERKKSVYVLEAGTGHGKSAIAYTVGKIVNQIEVRSSEGPLTLICTGTRALQMQYDRSHDDVSCIWSAMHYPCAKFPDDQDFYYGSSLCPKAQCRVKDRCEYLGVIRQFMGARIGVTNYHYYINAKFLNPNFLVLDEAHNVESILCNNSTILLSTKTARAIVRCLDDYDLGYDGPLYKIIEGLTKVKDCGLESTLVMMRDLSEELINVTSLIDSLNLQIEVVNQKSSLSEIVGVKRLLKVQSITKNLQQRVEDFTLYPDSWVISSKDEFGVKFKPLEMQGSFKRLIHSRCKYMLMMSSTICGDDQYCQEDLGIPAENYDFQSVPSTFPVENRKVYFNRTFTLNARNKDDILPKVINMMDNFIEALEENGRHRGIVHSVSYENAEMIKRLSRFRSRMVIPAPEEVMRLTTILESNPDTIIVSPSILEGLDLVDNLSRFQIFPKVPYGFLGDVWVKTRMKKNSRWYSREAIVRIVQGSGRSIRSEDDWAVTFILDGNFARLLSLREMFPSWYTDAIEEV